MTGSRANGTNPRAQGTNPRAEATRQQINDIERLLRLVCRKLNIDTTPCVEQGTTTGTDGGWHPPGSQPFGTRGVPDEVMALVADPDAALAPIPGADASTAREALAAAQRRRDEALTANDIRKDERTN